MSRPLGTKNKSIDEKNTIKLTQYIKITRFLVERNLCMNKDSAKRLILIGELRINNKIIKDVDFTINKKCKIQFAKHDLMYIVF